MNPRSVAGSRFRLALHREQDRETASKYSSCLHVLGSQYSSISLFAWNALAKVVKKIAISVRRRSRPLRAQFIFVVPSRRGLPCRRRGPPVVGGGHPVVTRYTFLPGKLALWFHTVPPPWNHREVGKQGQSEREEWEIIRASRRDRGSRAATSEETASRGITSRNDRFLGKGDPIFATAFPPVAERRRSSAIDCDTVRGSPTVRGRRSYCEDPAWDF